MYFWKKGSNHLYEEDGGFLSRSQEAEINWSLNNLEFPIRNYFQRRQTYFISTTESLKKIAIFFSLNCVDICLMTHKKVNFSKR